MAAALRNYLSKHSGTNLILLRSDPSVRSGHNLTLKSPKNSCLGTKLWVQPCSLRPHLSVCERRPFAATVSFSLPTANPEGVSPGQEVPKWSSKAIKSFAMAELEARKLKYPTTGTEALLMGLLIEESSPLTDEAQKALDWAVDRKIKSVDGGEITTAHILVGIWSEVDSPGHKILSTLGFNDEKAKELESLISKPGIKDD